MIEASRQNHWDDVYTKKKEDEVSWFQESPAPSIDLLELVGAGQKSMVIDVGGGASRLVDHLVLQGFSAVTVLDLSSKALDSAKARLGESSSLVEWIAADATSWEPPKTYDVWHDRAAFHFLTEAADQIAYADRLRRALRPGSYAILGTFGLDGPLMCSGLPIIRHSSDSLGAILGPDFRLIDSRAHEHVTPWGAVQKFQFSTFQKAAK